MIKSIIFYPFLFQLNIYFPREISEAYKDMDLYIFTGLDNWACYDKEIDGLYSSPYSIRQCNNTLCFWSPSINSL